MCAYAGCNRTDRHGRDLCAKHYVKMRRHGKIAEFRPHRIPNNAAAPIGTIRLRVHQNGLKRRAIKLGRDRWETYARWVWENAKGPIPKGLRVAHRDGDSLNDDLSNLFLARPDDVLAMAQIRDPSMARRALRASKKACAEAKRWHWRAFRATNYIIHSAYPVDLEGRRILNRPFRSKRAMYAAYVQMARPSPRGFLPMGAILGWPGLEYSEASVAFVLGAAPLPARVVQERASEVRARYGHDPLHIVTVYTAMCNLRRAGLAATVRRKYVLTERGLKERRRACPFVAVMGKELRGEKYAEFTRCDATGRPVVRAKAGSERAALLLKTEEAPKGHACANCGDTASKWRRRKLCPGCYAKFGAKP